MPLSALRHIRHGACSTKNRARHTAQQFGARERDTTTIGQSVWTSAQLPGPNTGAKMSARKPAGIRSASSRTSSSRQDGCELKEHTHMGHISRYLGLVTEAERILGDALVMVASRHMNEPDIRDGARLLSGWSEAHVRTLWSVIARFGRDRTNDGERLRGALFR